MNGSGLGQPWPTSIVPSSSTKVGLGSHTRLELESELGDTRQCLNQTLNSFKTAHKLSLSHSSSLNTSRLASSISRAEPALAFIRYFFFFSTMHQFNDRPNLEEPWAKRLRTTPSRNARRGREHYDRDHLPSPKPTNPSSTDNIPSSSSGTDNKPKPKPKPKQRPVHSLRERLVPPPKKRMPLSPIDNVQPAMQKPLSKPSVAPFFQRIEAAFQDKPAAATKASHAISTARAPARSPSPDAEDLIAQLKEHYLRTATSLHKQATMRLAQAHADLNRKLTQSLVTPDSAFLSQAEQQIKKLSQPLSKFRIRSQQRSADGTVKNEENSVGEIVAYAEEQVKDFEKEVKELWREWALAEGEVKELWSGVVALAEAGEGDREGEMMRRLRELIEREIEEAEGQVVGLGEEAVGMMKDVEKDFRKATLPDLHTFFQSIDEP
ncbi:hypothetical protein VTI74DRAFT_8784 [Chaetomium olivicolor]